MLSVIQNYPFGHATITGAIALTPDGNGFRTRGEYASQQLAAAKRPPPYSYRSVAHGSRQRQLIAISQDDIARRTPDRPGTFRTPEPHRRGRLTGPVVFVRGLLESWKLDRGAAVFLLGFERAESEHVERILNGAEPLISRDTKDRIAYLYRIRSTLSALFRSEDVENEWLREPRALLGERTPMELLREGSMANLLLVKEYVEEIAGI